MILRSHVGQHPIAVSLGSRPGLEIETTNDALGRDTRCRIPRRTLNARRIEPPPIQCGTRRHGARARRPAVDIVLHALGIEAVVATRLRLPAIITCRAVGQDGHVAARRVRECRGQGTEVRTRGRGRGRGRCRDCYGHVRSVQDQQLQS